MLAIVGNSLMLVLSLSIVTTANKHVTPANTPALCTAQKAGPLPFPSPIPSGCPVQTVTTAACPTVTTIVPAAFCLNYVCPQDVEGPGAVPCTVVVSTTTVGCPGRCCPTPPATVKSTAVCPDCRCPTTYKTVTQGC